MVATCLFSPIASLPIETENKTSKKQLGWWFNASRYTNPRNALNFKASVQTPTLTNGNSVSVDDASPAFYTNQFNTLNLLFGAFNTIFTEETNKGKCDDIFEEFGISAKFLDNGRVFCQDFSIRSYEVGADGTVSIETLISQLQETGLNHLKVTGLLGDGLGSTPEMCKSKLIWVATKTQIVVDHYPTWGDTIHVENWLVFSGKNSLRRDSVIRDTKTGDILVRATSNFVMMNKETRRLSRFPIEVREEMSPFCKDASPHLEDDCRKLIKLDEATCDFMSTDIKPRWSDLDLNQHVNNAKYIGWILESAPESTLKSHKLSRMTLEYKRECHRDDVLLSMTDIASADLTNLSHPDNDECNHMLKLKGGAEIMKARTEWIPK